MRLDAGQYFAGLDAAVDWDKTIAFREYLWDLGLGVAEAMDTAQRGMGLDWPMALELIKRSVAASRVQRSSLPVSTPVFPASGRGPTARSIAGLRRIAAEIGVEVV